jgi:putative transposase
VIDAAFVELAELTSTTRACGLLGKSRATHYRRQQPKLDRAGRPRPAPPNKLTANERAAVLAVLTCRRTTRDPGGAEGVGALGGADLGRGAVVH